MFVLSVNVTSVLFLYAIVNEEGPWEVDYYVT